MSYYPSLVYVIKKFIILIVFSFYFFMLSNKGTFEFYLWLFFLAVLWLVLAVKVYMLFNKYIDPVVSVNDGVISIGGNELEAYSINCNSLISVVFLKEKIILRVNNGDKKTIDISPLTNKDKKKLFYDIEKEIS